MSRNGSGVYSLPAGNPVVTGTTISSTWANTTLSDIATALTGSVAADGQTAMTGNLQMGNNKITGLAVATASGDALSYGQAATISALTVSGAFAANGGATLGDASGDALTINSSAVSIPNGLNFGSNNLVLSSGNVGIGTSSPVSQLHLVSASDSGLTIYKSAVGAGNMRVVSQGGGSALAFGSDQSTGTTERMRIDSSGNVGIGTGIAGAYSPSLRLGNSGSGGGVVTATLSLGSYSTGYGSNIISSSDFSSSSASYLAFGTTSTGASGLSAPVERMRIDSSGNVGIGTTSTSGYKLAVSDGTTFSVVHAGGGASYYGAITNNPVLFITNNTERMRIDSSGNLLVGTTSQIAAGKVSIQGNTAIAIRGANSSNSGDFEFYRADTGAKSWGINTNGANFFISDDNFSNYAFLSQNPTTWQFASDSRIKKNIQDLSYGLDAVMAIKPRSFDYIATNKHDIGFIAQELKDVIPEAVSGEEIPFDDADTPQERASKTLGVGKETLIPVLVKAIQELNAKVDSLQAELNTLKG